MEPILNEPRIDALADRIMRLERDNRRMRWFGSAAILGILSLAAISTTWGKPRPAPADKVIRAENFIAVDENGRGVIGIGTDIRERTRGAVEFLDKSGRPRMTLGLGDDDSPFVVISGQEVNHQIALEAKPGIGLGISFKDTKRNSGVMIGTSPEGAAVIGFMAEGGRPVMDLGVNPDGSSQLTFRDKDGKEIQQFPKP